MEVFECIEYMAEGVVSFARQRDFTSCRNSATASHWSAKPSVTAQWQLSNDRMNPRKECQTLRAETGRDDCAR